jgi:hypothetical protein
MMVFFMHIQIGYFFYLIMQSNKLVFVIVIDFASTCEVKFDLMATLKVEFEDQVKHKDF